MLVMCTKILFWLRVITETLLNVSFAQQRVIVNLSLKFL